MKERYIVLYADEFPLDILSDYCSACGVSPNSTSITIHFNYDDVESDDNENNIA